MRNCVAEPNASMSMPVSGRLSHDGTLEQHRKFNAVYARRRHRETHSRRVLRFTRVLRRHAEARNRGRHVFL